MKHARKHDSRWRSPCIACAGLSAVIIVMTIEMSKGEYTVHLHSTPAWHYWFQVISMMFKAVHSLLLHDIVDFEQNGLSTQEKTSYTDTGLLHDIVGFKYNQRNFQFEHYQHRHLPLPWTSLPGTSSPTVTFPWWSAPWMSCPASPL